jgi:hypothetical protein
LGAAAGVMVKKNECSLISLKIEGRIEDSTLIRKTILNQQVDDVKTFKK